MKVVTLEIKWLREGLTILFPLEFGLNKPDLPSDRSFSEIQ